MEEKINYEILTPNNMVENKAEDALKFALENEQVKNIAITGQYSSGKSSVIQSYFSKYINKKDYLNISLATFEKKKNEETTIEESNSLEKVIIEKLYYSIFNKYDLQRDIISSIITIFLVAFIDAGIYLFNMESINNSLTNNFWITLIFMGLEIICLTVLIGYSISYVINLQKIKLKFGDVEVEVNQTGNNQEKNRNLLNEEIEFIVKTMNIAKYKYIIFEDLDRFQNPQIFERLRDLNITLNATLKEKVKFLYAIKDEMFIADNRTKFFDFIIPVVPYVSYENSGEELYKIIKEHKIENELSEEFILDISLYVSDMRILKNSINEYIIYNKTLEKKVPDYEKLFSILLYKNTCSVDFSKLQKHDGNVYKIFNEKKKYIEKVIGKINAEIEKYREEIKEQEKTIISLNLFKDLMINQILLISNRTVTITTKTANQIDIESGMNPNLIPDDIISDKSASIYYFYNGTWRTKKLEDFLKEHTKSLYELYNRLDEKNRDIREELEEEIRKKQQEIQQIQEMNLSEILEIDDSILEELEENSYKDLIKYLLRNGYIEENYSIYINKFHEGSITECDYSYIMSVKNKTDQQIDIKLDNPHKIIKRLKNNEFKREEVLNIYILDALLSNIDSSEKTNIFINTLINSKKYILFIIQYIKSHKTSNENSKFLNQLCKKDKDIWKNIDNEVVEKENKNKIIEEILLNVNINHIKQFKDLSVMIEYIEDEGILQNNDSEIIKEIINKLDIRYTNISNMNKKSNLYKFIVENNYYKINFTNIRKILDEKENMAIFENNYEEISKNINLKSYIDENMQLYIDDVFLKLENKQKDSALIIKELINNHDISIESKKSILLKEEKNIENIENIEDKELWEYIFEHQLIQIHMNNIELYYEEKGLDNTLIKVFNRDAINNDIFKEIKINVELLKELLICDQLNIDVYKYILEKIVDENIDIEIAELSEDKVEELITKKKLKLNKEMLQRIRDYSKKALEEAIKQNYNYIHKEIDNGNLEFTIVEIEYLLNSKLSDSIKLKSIDMIKEEDIESMSNELINNIAALLIRKKEKNKLTFELLLKLLRSINQLSEKVKLLNLNFNIVDTNNISNCLKCLSEDYEKIIIDRAKPRLVYSRDNIELLKNIEDLGYNIKYNISNEQICLTNTMRM